MYCTGGIRCDVYTAFLARKGFRNLYTLEGGVQNYLVKEGGGLWNGSLFVFDGRMAIPPGEPGEGRAGRPPARRRAALAGATPAPLRPCAALGARQAGRQAGRKGVHRWHAPARTPGPPPGPLRGEGGGPRARLP
jgi:hypothetical protein